MQAALRTINRIIGELNGASVQLTSLLAQARLEPYTIILLFYKLDKIYGTLDLAYATQAISSNPTIEDILNKARNYDPGTPV